MNLTVILRASTARISCFSESLLPLALFFVIAFRSAATTVIYQTSFEANEGYDPNLTLVGQGGWLGAGSGGNGLGTGLLPGLGQQAYIGFAPPAPGGQSLFLYQPINCSPTNAHFSVTMGVIDSSNTNWDDFYWSVFNQQQDQLFTIDFDNNDLNVYYSLDGTNTWNWSGRQFTNGLAYFLQMDLDFAGNRWSATLNGALLASNQPITTVGSPLNLGDIDAAWVVMQTNAPGDNYMVFDDYQIGGSVPPPALTVTGWLGRSPVLRLSGRADNLFALEASTNLVTWTPLKTNITTGGSFDYTDGGAVGLPGRFYRGRWVP